MKRLVNIILAGMIGELITLIDWWDFMSDRFNELKNAD